MCAEGVKWLVHREWAIRKKGDIRKARDTSEAFTLTCNYGNYFQFYILGSILMLQILEH